MSPKSAQSSETNFRVDLQLSGPMLEKALSLGRLPATGELTQQALPRLGQEVLAIDGPVRWSFSPDPRPLGPGRRRRRWWLDVSADLVCTCERCLGPVDLTLETRRGFEFFESAAKADAYSLKMDELESESDPDTELVDYLSPEDGMTIATLVEDEILLNMPMAPKHGQCELPADLAAEPALADGGGPEAGAGAETDQPETVRPFLGLKDMLKKR